MSDDLIKALQKEAREDAEIITRLRADLAAANTRMSKLDFERTAAELERDALAAHLAPVDDRNLEILAAKEWIEATTDMPPRTAYTISERSLAGARAAIAAIRPHIEAAERERCAKAGKAALLKSNYGELHADANYADELGEEIAAAIRSGK